MTLGTKSVLNKQKLSRCLLDDNSRPSLERVQEELVACRKQFAIGDLDGAEVACRNIISIEPENADAWYYLGLISHRRGDNIQALELLRKSTEFGPNHAEAHNHYGNALRVQGRYDEALMNYRKAVELNSGYAAPLYNIGLVLVALGQPGKAEHFFKSALELDNSFSAALNSLGILRLDQKNPEEAAQLFRKALESTPGNLEVLNNLGIAHIDLKQYEEAVHICRTAIAIVPECPEVHNTLGIALKNMGSFTEAAASYQRALELRPVYPDALNNLGNLLRETGRLREALDLLKKALAHSPSYATAWHSLGLVYREQGELEEAISCHRQALGIRADYAEAWNDLAGALVAQGRIEEAVESYKKAVASKPKFYLANSNMLLAMHYSPHYSTEDIFQESLNWSTLFGVAPRVDHLNDPEPDRMLRIGYVSQDFRRHSVSYFLKPIFNCYEKANVSVTCYSDVLVPDEHTEFYRRHSDCWRNIVGLTDGEVSRIVTADGIDILVDLAGHTGIRMPLFALKPAPVQVTWLGYPGTTGLSAIDYRFTDEVADPVGPSDVFHSEKLYRLQNGFLCYSPPNDAPDVVRVPFHSNGFITFGSFNNLAKITRDVVEAWCNILAQVPGSRLVMKCHSLADGNTRRRYGELFSECAISPERIEMRPWLQGTASHLAAYGEIDIALDPFPYNGTTTTFESLWMGVPVVTLRGDRHAGRVGASILTRLGLACLVASSVDEYVSIAVQLAADTSRLTAVREDMRGLMNSSGLCDSVLYAREVEAAYRLMWQAWCSEKLRSLHTAGY